MRRCTRHRFPGHTASLARVALGVASLGLATVACTPLRPLDPADDGGRRSDTGRPPDAPSLDAPLSDAPGLDAAGLDAFAAADAPDDAPSSDVFSPPDAFTPDAGCFGAPRCVGAVLRTCSGGRGIDTDCPLGCVTVDGGAHCGELVPSNVPSTVLDGVTMDYMPAGTVTLDTSACPSPIASFMGLTYGVVTQSDGSEVCVFGVRSFTIPASTTMRITGSRPFVVLASADATIDGVLDASAVGVTVGAGGGGGGASGRPASGPAPGGAGMRGAASTTEDAGGGGGAGCGSGGAGGDSRPSTGGRGGVGAGSSTLSPLTGGSGGGAGSGSSAVGAGGGGGGALQVTALGAIVVRGSVRVGGGGGQRSSEGMAGAAGGGGGGGAGGGILLEAPSVTLEADASLLATGGGGGPGASPTFAETAAEDGAVLARRARGGMGGGGYGATGGESGAVDTPDGLAGEDNAMMGNGAGGGGGAGCIVLRSYAAPITTGAMLSPSGVGLATLPLATR